METLRRASSLAVWNKSLFLPCPSEAHCHSASHKHTHTHTIQQQQMDFELWGSLFSLHYRWRAAPSLSVNGIKWHRLLLLFFPMILFPCRFPEAHREGTVDGGGGLCSMPELNSTSPLSNSQAVTLTSPTRPLKLSWQPGVPHTLITHGHPPRAPPRLQHYPHLLHYYALLLCCF